MRYPRGAPGKTAGLLASRLDTVDVPWRYVDNINPSQELNRPRERVEFDDAIPNLDPEVSENPGLLKKAWGIMTNPYAQIGVMAGGLMLPGMGSSGQSVPTQVPTVIQRPPAYHVDPIDQLAMYYYRR